MKVKHIATGIIMFVLCNLFLLFNTTELGNPIQQLVAKSQNKGLASQELPGHNLNLFSGVRVEASALENEIPELDVAVSPMLPSIPQTSPVVRGLYSTGWSAGSAKMLSKLVDMVDHTYLNAMVIDVKDDEGTLSYKSQIPLAQEIGSSEGKIKDINGVMATLQEKKIYPIARIVVFKDPLLAKKYPEWAVKSKSGGLWRDRKGLAWVDPYNKSVWQYVVEVAKESAKLGFKEIQFDYVRFTSDGNLSDCVYSYADGRKKRQVIKDFLHYAYGQLKPYNVVVSADVFGLVLSVPDDLGIGQQLEDIAQEVDFICPMVYPSHYYRGTFGIQNPNAKPYEIILHSLRDAEKRIGGMKAKLRPWLQDFNLGDPPYHREEIAAQIRAVKEMGIEEWLWWNPSNRYDQYKHSFTQAELASIKKRVFPPEDKPAKTTPQVKSGSTN